MSDMYIPLSVEPIVRMFNTGNIDIEVFDVIITADDYRVCDEFSKAMWSSSKGGHWGSGMINSKSDPAKVERTGILGEMGFAKLLGMSIDIEYVVGGDASDFVFFNKKTINVKTSATNYNQALIRARTSGGHDLVLKQDFYVFALIQEEDREAKIATVSLIGFEQKANVLKLPMVPALKGEHLNYSLPYNKLQPFRMLYDAYRRKKYLLEHGKM